MACALKPSSVNAIWDIMTQTAVTSLVKLSILALVCTLRPAISYILYMHTMAYPDSPFSRNRRETLDRPQNMS